MRFQAMVARKKHMYVLLAAAMGALGYLLLLIPESEAPIEAAVSRPIQSEPFLWNQDAFWRALESASLSARSRGCAEMRPRIDANFERITAILLDVSHRSVPPDDSSLRNLEKLTFQMAPWITGCPDKMAAFSQLVTEIRMEAKRQSRHWDMSDSRARTTLYRLIYGGRAAIEEILLQMPHQNALPALVPGMEEPSSTPWASILGIKIHSGDILISRGGAAISALIARGNDFAGNFSHVALVYVHPKTHLASIIEAHIESGVAISTLEDYLKDVKLRVMVLRPRSDLPQLVADPMLPHRAAEYALNRAKEGHIPYDFAMDFADADRLFCSEVASMAYRKYGLNLWMGLSHISSPGLRRWLAGFGVRSFVTEEPSDLEYDPQLQIVAEWRDLDTLRADHVDNAVTEVMLDGANMGEPLKYDHYLLPWARLLKLYSAILNSWGRIGPIPEGMSSTAALRHKWYTRRHESIKAAVVNASKRFECQHGYVPPYWRLIELAQQAKSGDGPR